MYGEASTLCLNGEAEPLCLNGEGEALCLNGEGEALCLNGEAEALRDVGVQFMGHIVTVSIYAGSNEARGGRVSNLTNNISRRCTHCNWLRQDDALTATGSGKTMHSLPLAQARRCTHCHWLRHDDALTATGSGKTMHSLPLAQARRCTHCHWLRQDALQDASVDSGKRTKGITCRFFS